MADSCAFDHVCSALENATSLNRIESRGTVRLALKTAGLSANSVTPEQMAVVIDRLFPVELENRGVANPDGVCLEMKRGLSTVVPDASTGDTPESVFDRLGGS